MRTNEEIRNEAWTKLWHEKWFWRILIASILLDLSMQLIFKIIYFVANTCIGDLGTLSQTNLSNSLAMIARGDMSALPTITLHIAITAFMTIIATGITQFGKSTVLLRAADGKQEGYLKAAFEGLKMPLGLAYLTLRVALVFILWGFLAILPCIGGAAICELIAIDETSIKIAAWALIITAVATFSLAIIAIPFYRYRFLFRIKADNPEWSAGKCMKECRSLTDGRKWRIFKHDCSYWKILLLPLITGSALSAIMLICLYKMKINFYAKTLATPKSMVFCFSVIGLYIVFIAVTIISAIYISLGQTILYRETPKPAVKKRGNNTTESNQTKYDSDIDS